MTYCPRFAATLMILALSTTMALSSPETARAAITAPPAPKPTTSKPTALTPGAAKPIALPTGRFITPQGTQTNVGSFPCNALLSPDGKFLAVTNVGARQCLSILDARSGKLLSQLEIKGRRPDPFGRQKGLYYGLAFAPSSTSDSAGLTLYASRGEEQTVAIYHIDSQGKLTEDPRRLQTPPPPDPNFRRVIAGLALDSRGRILYAADNNTTSQSGLKGELLVLDTQSGQCLRTVKLGGFPFAVAALTRGPQADKRIYVSSERDGVIDAVDSSSGQVISEIKTGASPVALLLDHDQRRLFAANASSDTISVIDTATDQVIDTILLRPDDVRGLPGVTPTGLALAPEGGRLYVSLADMNAVAVIDLPKVSGPAALRGYIPAGWYPTAVAASADGKRLLVANAKGVNSPLPNPSPYLTSPKGRFENYILDIIEGTVSNITLPDEKALEEQTRQVVANNRIKPTPAEQQAQAALKNPGIRHIFYIIKENRTYDQVFGDLPQGNGDASMCIFPREVTPNQHALAERFVLLDNFYACAEVSADGWNWSTSGMVSEYTTRNSVYNYNARGRKYDFEGRNNEVAVDLIGVPDVATAPCGYIWDLVLGHGIELRNYGFFSTIIEDIERRRGWKRYLSEENTPTKKALVGRTDNDFRTFEMGYADSEAWLRYNCPETVKEKAYGQHKAPSRYTEWKREFDQYVKNGNLPPFVMIRLPRNHTKATAPGYPTPQAMVADNDYGVGQLVEAISNSPYWKESAIFILEDDAQNGHDHVDAHRSPALIISPFIRKGTVDHTFHNTDSMLRTMEVLMGLPPMNQYDALAAPIAVFLPQPENAAPYRAILPARDIIAALNGKGAYKAKVSASLDFSKEDAVPDAVLNDILWHAVKGAQTPEPPIRRGLRLFAAADQDDD